MCSQAPNGPEVRAIVGAGGRPHGRSYHQPRAERIGAGVRLGWDRYAWSNLRGIPSGMNGEPAPAAEGSAWGHMFSHFDCGLHSGIPTCCVYFFNQVWLQMTGGQFHEAYSMAIDRWMGHIPIRGGLVFTRRLSTPDGRSSPGWFIPCPNHLRVPPKHVLKRCACHVGKRPMRVQVRGVK